ncbi:sec-independent protein translocase protein TatB [Stackebrandtia endophytica]|uniref:Sec-independent protein translocase protein TatB n=1 Tax=Stackebrandtia endophytica TaxID=1496996 RepID=A0A543AU83_9ACTN|nr:twin-arginine translocase TatA/TatE family subunit [Stackebrandtia endophytica]TQL76129.1 sec-independent protein translocase protein TatB [Stackebrandtia endophytica]
MLENLGGWEIIALLLVALFVIGPERLPKMMGELGKMIRKLRNMAANAQADISREVGTDIDITDLNPKTFLRKHVLSEADEEALKNPLKSALNDLKKEADGVKQEFDDTTSAIKSTTAGRANRRAESEDDVSSSQTEISESSTVEPPQQSSRRSFDLDAT